MNRREFICGALAAGTLPLSATEKQANVPLRIAQISDPQFGMTTMRPICKRIDGPDHAAYPLKGRTRRLERYLKTGARFYLAGHTHRMGVRGYKGLTILNAETTCLNFDGRPRGFRLLEITSLEGYTWKFVRI